MPLTREMTGFMVIVTITGAFQVFNEVMVMTAGGPNNSSQVLGTWLYQQGFIENDFLWRGSRLRHLSYHLADGLRTALVHEEAEGATMNATHQPRETEHVDFVRVLAKACLVTLFVSLGIVVIYPLLWMALNGFKSNSEIFGNPFALPTNFTIENYISAWNQGIRNYIATSIIVTLGSAVCTVLISARTAYGLTRSKLPGKPYFIGIVLGGLMLSPTVAVIPLVRMMQDLGLYNTYWAPIILYTAFHIPFTTFLIRAYMLRLPRDLDEAATMDGASEGQIFWRVILPLCKPILVSCVIVAVPEPFNKSHAGPRPGGCGSSGRVSQWPLAQRSDFTMISA